MGLVKLIRLREEPVAGSYEDDIEYSLSIKIGKLIHPPERLSVSQGLCSKEIAI
jgi:hypothetical protein